jgi:hypothetical protein
VREEEVLRPEDDSLLREGRLLPEEPGVLQYGQDPEMLSSRPEVRGPDPPRRDRRQASHRCDLLSGCTLQREPEALLPGGTGGAQQPGIPHSASWHQPGLLPAGPDLPIGWEPVLRKPAIRSGELRNVRKCLCERRV